jgi:hypothetical protein
VAPFVRLTGDWDSGVTNAKPAEPTWATTDGSTPFAVVSPELLTVSLKVRLWLRFTVDGAALNTAPRDAGVLTVMPFDTGEMRATTGDPEFPSKPWADDW